MVVYPNGFKPRKQYGVRIVSRIKVSCQHDNNDNDVDAIREYSAKDFDMAAVPVVEDEERVREEVMVRITTLQGQADAVREKLEKDRAALVPSAKGEVDGGAYADYAMARSMLFPIERGLGGKKFQLADPEVYRRASNWVGFGFLAWCFERGWGGYIVSRGEEQWWLRINLVGREWMKFRYLCALDGGSDMERERVEFIEAVGGSVPRGIVYRGW